MNSSQLLCLLFHFCPILQLNSFLTPISDKIFPPSYRSLCGHLMSGGQASMVVSSLQLIPLLIHFFSYDILESRDVLAILLEHQLVDLF
jgi:hypothetical protein